MKSRPLLSCGKYLLGTGLFALAAGMAFLYSGWYPIGADVPHNGLTYWALETLRERSIARASADIEVPGDLGTPKRLLAGGADYNDMCAGCHLRPGEKESDFTLGLYPVPPNLSLPHAQADRKDLTAQARRRFWIIKHGIKASGMPAWGPTHDDERIWNMVAFLQRLPELTPEQYQILTARSDEEAMPQGAIQDGNQP
ncbi:c-type cytochrome [Thermomonas hydrothermalis]|uniref:Cytochrome c553 n=1 Tax=Thermomonas hydrothermalis TaxID=213588 RepID=A0A1M5AAD0_9GAMM|nr:cytochrome c [Thermomonas hydrothermalis]SHF27223.1 Cytochrome c553 [Thermomonas hydrothermalis]HXF07479.1 cytochrome c [Candidatus Acidoferrales bacterium]